MSNLYYIGDIYPHLFPTYEVFPNESLLARNGPVADLVLVFDAVAITRSITWCILIILEIVALIGAVRAYRAKRSRAFCFLLCACISYIIARTAWFTFGVVKDVFSLTIGPTAVLWQFLTVTFDTLFLIFLILALVSFIREQRISN